MKRWIALAVGALAIFGAAGPAAAAAARARAQNRIGAARNLRAGTADDALGVAFTQQAAGPGLAVTLDPGATDSHDLVVSNRTSNLRLTVGISSTDAAGAPVAQTATWLAFGSDVVEIDPHSAQTIPVTIAVPHDTQPGQQLAHVVVTVQSAALASDGSPRPLQLHKTLPVSITVNGAPTAQIAIIDVQRIDNGKTHQLGVVMRNFGDRGANVTGTLRVVSDKPQTHPFAAQLAPRRDTTLLVPWDATPKDTAADVDVEATYNGGDTVSWASEVGGPPTTTPTIENDPTQAQTDTPTSVATSPTVATASGDGAAAASSAGDPWWKKNAVPGGIVLAIVLAALWFFFELRSSRRRREEMPAQQPFFVMPGGWAPGTGGASSNDATVELAKQLVALSDVIVRLAVGESEPPQPTQEIYTARARARSPDADPPPAPAAPGAHVKEEPTEPTWHARAEEAEELPEPEPAPEPVPEPEPEPTPELEPQPEPDPRPLLLEQLLGLDRERRRLHRWMDDSEEALAWPSDDELERFAREREEDN